MNGYSVTAILAALALACLVVIGMLLPTVANAQSTACGERQEIIDMLAKKYQEVPRGIGIAQTNVLEFFVSKEGTWTALLSSPNRQSCIVAAGDSWEDIEAKMPGTPL